MFLCALWNGKDPILKERLFGLGNAEGNHGEDVKELYYYLDNLPSHYYMEYLYKYPQQEFPYNQLREENRNRSHQDPEYELLDTGIFDKNEYFDVKITYAKVDGNGYHDQDRRNQPLLLKLLRSRSLHCFGFIIAGVMADWRINQPVVVAIEEYGTGRTRKPGQLLFLFSKSQ